MSWSVRVDRELCNGFAACVMTAPDVFELDNENKSVPFTSRPDDSLRTDVEDAVRGCPVKAIMIVED